MADDNLSMEMATSTAIITVPIGTIVPFAGSAIPDGWLLCDGRTISGVNYPELVKVLGGTTLPALGGRMVIGVGSLNGNTYTLNQAGGEATHTLSVNEMPQHHHSIYLTTSHGTGEYTADGHYSDVLAGDRGGAYMDSANWNNSNAFIQDTGGNGAHQNMSPFLALNYIIKY